MAPTLNAHFGDKQGLEDQHALGGGGLFVPAVTNALTNNNGQRNEVSDMVNGLIVNQPVVPPVAASQTRGAESAGKGGYAGRRQEDDVNLVAFNARQDPDVWSGDTGPMDTDGSTQAIAFAIQAGAVRENPKSGPDGIGVSTDGAAYTVEARSEVQAVARGWAVRRLTPVECCRLQGFPDDYLSSVTYRGKPPADGPMYKALGNSMAVNVMRVIGERIAMVDAL